MLSFTPGNKGSRQADVRETEDEPSFSNWPNAALCCQHDPYTNEPGANMKSVVVYESMYGNSHRVADIVGAVLGESGDCEVLPVLQANTDHVNNADLVVVGGPTHDHSMSTRRSRAQAEAMAIEDAANLGVAAPAMDPYWQGPGLRDWFRELPVSPEPIAASGGQFAAAFDTRLNARALLTGRASRSIARRLTRHGFVLIAEPESFLVDKDTGLLESEAARAELWAKGLVSAISAEQAPPLEWMTPKE